jgi:hypothetical protein
MVAGRHRHHAAGLLIRAELQQLVQRAALLEARGELVVFEFQPDFRAADLDRKSVV